MSSKFTLDEAAFRREIDGVVASIAREQTAALAVLRDQYQGQPVESIKPAIKQVFAHNGGDITDPELSEWAQLIHDGVAIEVKPEGRW